MSWSMRIGGYPATEIAAHTPPTWETLADGGCGEASWEFSISSTAQHQALRPESHPLAEILYGPLPLYTGTLTDFDRNTGECKAFGLSSESKNYLALDGTDASTRDLGAALARAIGAGWRILNTENLAGVVSGDAAGNPVSIGQLLDDYAAQNGMRWGIDHKRRLFMRADSTTVSWLASPGSVALGSTNEDRAGKLYGRYLDSTTGLYDTASRGSGVELAVDLTDRGAMTRPQAIAVLDGMLKSDHSGPAWTNGVTLTKEQLQTPGGTSAFLAGVRGGQLMRSLGLASAYQSLALDTLIGKTRYTAGDDSIYIEPVNTAPRGFVNALASL